MPRIYLALGSNLGDRAANLNEALKRLKPRVRVTRVSKIYETEPWGVLDQPRFLNMAAEGETDLSPEALLQHIKELERTMGRSEGVRYGPRIIDLDILFYNALQLKNETLEIPHPRVAERRFVLIPLAELAPDLIHPALHLTINQLLARLADQEDVRLYPPTADLPSSQTNMQTD